MSKLLPIEKSQSNEIFFIKLDLDEELLEFSCRLANEFFVCLLEFEDLAFAFMVCKSFNRN